MAGPRVEWYLSHRAEEVQNGKKIDLRGTPGQALQFITNQRSQKGAT